MPKNWTVLGVKRDAHAKIQQTALQENISMSSLVTKMVDFYLRCKSGDSPELTTSVGTVGATGEDSIRPVEDDLPTLL